MWAALRGAQIGDLVRSRCPTASTPWWASAATGSPAARSSASRSPACCSRRRAIVILDEATAHLDSESEAPSSAPSTEALAGRTVARHRPPPVDRPRGRPDPGRRRRPHRGARHARRAARRRRPVRRAVPHPVRAPVTGSGYLTRPESPDAGMTASSAATQCPCPSICTSGSGRSVPGPCMMRIGRSSATCRKCGAVAGSCQA